MKKIIFILFLVSCNKDYNTYVCKYQYYNTKIDTNTIVVDTLYTTKDEINEIGYRNNAYCYILE